tara:strand:+ start:215 stop:1498 length:1284 start_codon:yes stop_codon:yes gene_type:complete
MLGLGNTLSKSGVLSRYPNNYSLEFDGTDNYLNLLSPTALDNFYDNGGTFSAWIYPTDTTSNQVIYDKADGGQETNTLYLSLESSGKYKLQFKREWDTQINARWTNSSYVNQPLYKDAWNHVVLTYDSSAYGNSPVFYVNGERKSHGTEDAPGSGETVVSDASYNLRIGYSNNNDKPFKGNIDEVAIWDEILDAEAVSAIYNSGSPIDLTKASGDYDNEGDLVGWWRAGDGTLDDYDLISDSATPTLGSELFDEEARIFRVDGTYLGSNPVSEHGTDTYGWTQEGSNGLENDSGELKITYGDAGGSGGSGEGARLYLRNITDLSSNLEAAGIYKLTFDARYEGGSVGVGIKVYQSGLGAYKYTKAFTTSTVNYTLYFFASAASDFIRLNTLASGNIVYLDNFSLKKVNGNPALMINMAETDIVTAVP